jgi:hypothetical protein
MNPYSRFNKVSNLLAAGVIVALVLVFGLPGFERISNLANGDTGLTLMATIGAGIALLVVGWLALTGTIFPILFRVTALRRLILGKYYIEGTWLQAERGAAERRMSVIDIQPDGYRFIFSGYALNEELEIEANTLIEFSRFEWPFMVYKYRNSLSDGSDGKREGVGEIQLEMNQASARRYNGFLQYVRSSERLKIEGAKLTSQAEVRSLRRLDGRQRVFEKYWKLFFHRAMRPSSLYTYPVRDEAYERATVLREETARVAATAAPVQTRSHEPHAAPPLERRDPTRRAVSSEGQTVVPRRRATDWASDDRRERSVRIKVPTATDKTGTNDGS